MPSFYAANISVKLSVAPLCPSLTATPSYRSGSDAKAYVNAVEAALERGQALRETPINCLNDGTGLHFLGSQGEAPFLCVGIDLGKQPDTIIKQLEAQNSVHFPTGRSTTLRSSTGGDENSMVSTLDSSLSSLGSTPQLSPISIIEQGQQRTTTKAKRPTNAGPVKKQQPKVKDKILGHTPKSNLTKVKFQPPQQSLTSLYKSATPGALVLHVNLSEKSFNRSAKCSTPQDLKIEVLLNGHLTHCSLIPSRLKSDTAGLKLRFSGRRIGRVLEKAWMVMAPKVENLPSQLTTADPAVDHQAEASHRIENVKRWQDISTGLQDEKASRGVNEKGEYSPTAEYLESLAKMQIPEALLGHEANGELRFAILDVVISLGDGKKFPTSKGYLLAPERLKDITYRIASSSSTMGPPSTGDLPNMTNRQSGSRTKGQPSEQALTETNFSERSHGTNKPSYPSIAVAPVLGGLTRKVLSTTDSEQTTSARAVPEITGMASTGGLRVKHVASTAPRRSDSLDSLDSARLGDPEYSSDPLVEDDTSLGVLVEESTGTAATHVARSRSWSYRSQDGAKTPIRASSTRPDPAKSRNGNGVLVMIPHRSESRPSTPHTILENGSSEQESPPSTKLQSPFSNTIHPIASVDLEPFTMRTNLALKEGATPSGSLLSAISRGLINNISLRDHFSSTTVPSPHSTTSAITTLTPLQRVARRPLVETCTQPLGSPRIAIADGEAAVYVMDEHHFQPPIPLSTGIGTTTMAFEAAVKERGVPEISLPLQKIMRLNTGLRGGNGGGSAEIKSAGAGTGTSGAGNVGVGAAANGKGKEQSKKKRKRSLSNTVALEATEAPSSPVLAVVVRPEVGVVEITAPANAHGIPFVPALCEDCVITYGVAGGAGEAQAVRQVRAERGGDFKETEVLLGIRFLVDVGIGS